MGALHGLSRPEDRFASCFDYSHWKLSCIVDNKKTRHSEKQVHEFLDKFVNNTLAAVTTGKKSSVD
ncbi:Cytochrome P450 E-class CYP52 [Penicillium atrosanguineum]|nr:Cytochrome P450 E-class CYP52 [Penicillium atrosanguineum]